MKATEGLPALGASLNICGCNIGIALGGFIGSRMIDLFGLASVGLAGRSDYRCSDGRYPFPGHHSAPASTTLIRVGPCGWQRDRSYKPDADSCVMVSFWLSTKRAGETPRFADAGRVDAKNRRNAGHPSKPPRKTQISRAVQESI